MSDIKVARTVHWCDAGQCWPATVMQTPTENGSTAEPNLDLAVMQNPTYYGLGADDVALKFKSYQPHGHEYGNWHRWEECTR